MRGSGFGPSNRFGPFNVDVIHYNPVCLNSLLYQMEVDAAGIAHILGRDNDSARWKKLAEKRAAQVNALMWDTTEGLFTSITTSCTSACADNTSGDVRFGYRSNEVGFGWTNAVFTALVDDLPAEKRGSYR